MNGVVLEPSQWLIERIASACIDELVGWALSALGGALVGLIARANADNHEKGHEDAAGGYRPKHLRR